MSKTQGTIQGNEASAMPIRGLSKRAQAMLQPKPWINRTPVITARFQGEIPKALKSGGAKTELTGEAA